MAVPPQLQMTREEGCRRASTSFNSLVSRKRDAQDVLLYESDSSYGVREYRKGRCGDDCFVLCSWISVVVVGFGDAGVGI